MASRKKKTKTLIRRALQDDSHLRAKVQDGIGAVKKTDRTYLAEDIRGTLEDSLDLDAALQQDHRHENRWDYLLGHNPSEQLVAVEPHSAKQDAITTVINKRTAAKRQLVTHLKPGTHVSKWIWVASGKIYFADTEKIRRRLDQNGIEFAGGRVLAKHLPVVAPKKSGRRK